MGVPHLVPLGLIYFPHFCLNLFLQDRHPHPPAWNCYLSVLPPGQACHRRRNILEVSSSWRPQRHLRQPLGYTPLYHR